MKTVTVESLCSLITSGGTPSRARPEYYEPARIPWVKTGDLEDRQITSRLECISDAGLANSAAKVLPQHTTLMAMYGATVGKLGWLARPAACNQASCAMIADPERCDWRWLFYALLWARGGLVGLASGAAQQNLNAGIIRRARIPAHDLATQRAVADVLGALDDKIAANQRVAVSASELARAHWMRAGELGEAMPLSSLARFVNGGAYTRDASGAGRVVIRIAELNSGLGDSTVYNDIVVPEDNLARPGDLLFAWSGSLTVARWYRPEAIVNQHIFKVIPQDAYPLWLVHQALLDRLEDFRSIAADKATTMGHIQRRHLDEPVMVPLPRVVSTIDVLMRGLWEGALAAEMENLVLEETRDLLLPLLISGMLRARDAEKLGEGVV